MFSLCPMPNWLFPFRAFFPFVFLRAANVNSFSVFLSFLTLGKHSQFSSASGWLQKESKEREITRKSQIFFYGRLRCCEIKGFTASSNKHQHLFGRNKLRFVFLFPAAREFHPIIFFSFLLSKLWIRFGFGWIENVQKFRFPHLESETEDSTDDKYEIGWLNVLALAAGCYAKTEKYATINDNNNRVDSYLPKHK